MSILNYGAAALFVVIGMAFGGYAGSGLERFDYEAASIEERQLWLEARSITVRSKVNDAFAGGVGGQQMWVLGTSVDASEKRIDFHVGVSGPADVETGATREFVLRGFCSRYLNSSMAEHGITVRLQIEHGEGAKIFSLPITTETCKPFAGA